MGHKRKIPGGTGKGRALLSPTCHLFPTYKHGCTRTRCLELWQEVKDLRAQSFHTEDGGMKDGKSLILFLINYF